VKEVRLGIIGAGGVVAYGHLPALADMNEVRLASICDVQKDRAQGLAEQYGIERVYARARAVLQDPEVDAVLVATPTAYHKPLVLEALQRGKHVFCEKPPAMNAAQATEMLAMARRKRKALFYGFNQRYTERSRALKSLVRRNRLGDLYYLRAGWTRRRLIPGLGGWFTTKRLSGGGPLIDIGVHVLDLALWFCDYPRVRSVSGATFHDLGKRVARQELGAAGARKMQVEDLAVAYIRLDSGAVIFLETSFALHTRSQEEVYVDLCGTRGGAEWRFPLGENAQQPPLVILGEEDGRPYDLIPRIQEGQPWQSYGDEMRDFLGCMAQPSLSWTQAAHGVQLMKVIDALYESAGKRKEVAVR